MQVDSINLTTDFTDAGDGSTKKFQVATNLTSQTSHLEPGWINLSELMALSDVFSFRVNSILQGSSNPQSLRQSEVDVLFDIPLIGLFEAVRFESYPFHEAILL